MVEDGKGSYRTLYAMVKVWRNLWKPSCLLHLENVDLLVQVCSYRLYDNSDQRRIRTKNQIRTKDKFGPNFEIRPKLFR